MLKPTDIPSGYSLPNHSRTLNQIFMRWKSEQDQQNRERWTDYWHSQWTKVLDWYFSMNWHLIELPKFSKQPFYGSHGSQDDKLSRQEAEQAVSEGHNLAKVALDQPIIDVDQEHIGDLGKMICRTPTCRTPRGWRFFTKGPYDKAIFKELKRKYPFLDTPRTDLLYALVPLSQARIEIDHKELAIAPRVYEWVSDPALLDFSTFCLEALR